MFNAQLEARGGLALDLVLEFVEQVLAVRKHPTVGLAAIFVRGKAGDFGRERGIADVADGLASVRLLNRTHCQTFRLEKADKNGECSVSFNAIQLISIRFLGVAYSQRVSAFQFRCG